MDPNEIGRGLRESQRGCGGGRKILILVINSVVRASAVLDSNGLAGPGRKIMVKSTFMSFKNWKTLFCLKNIKYNKMETFLNYLDKKVLI